MSLNCAGLLKCRIFSVVDTTLLHHPRFAESAAVEPWICRNYPCGGPAIQGFLTAQRVDAPTSCCFRVGCSCFVIWHLDCVTLYSTFYEPVYLIEQVFIGYLLRASDHSGPWGYRNQQRSQSFPSWSFSNCLCTLLKNFFSPSTCSQYMLMMMLKLSSHLQEGAPGLIMQVPFSFLSTLLLTKIHWQLQRRG